MVFKFTSRPTLARAMQAASGAAPAADSGKRSHALDRPAAELLGVFYSEFDNVLGPKIVYQAGQCPSSELFDKVSDYFITKPHLVGKIVTVCECKDADVKVMGFPMRVEGSKYHRCAVPPPPVRTCVPAAIPMR